MLRRSKRKKITIASTSDERNKRQCLELEKPQSSANSDDCEKVLDGKESSDVKEIDYSESQTTLRRSKRKKITIASTSDERNKGQCSELEKLEKPQSFTISDDCEKVLKGKESSDVKEIDYSEEEEINIPDDMRTSHFQHELSKDFVSQYNGDELVFSTEQWPILGDLNKGTPALEENRASHVLSRKTKLSEFCIKENVLRACQESKLLKHPNKLSPLQFELFSIISKYVDFLYTKRTHLNGEDVRFVYCLHTLNHILKARAKIIHHNYKLSKNPDEEFRDQGFTRPTVLILVPFRESCSRIVKILISLLENCDVLNKKRFFKEYGSEKDVPRKRPKPADFEATFVGNTNEDFKIGLRIKNKSICLYSDFYSSDMIIASPLGLRTLIGAEGDSNRDYDFLSSIEVFVVDQADVLLMQNWMHVTHIARHLNMQPKEPHGCDFSRIRAYLAQGYAKFFRQTILLSAVEHTYHRALHMVRSFNYAGNVHTWATVECTSISKVAVPVPQYFRRFQGVDHITEPDERFNYFTSEILPDFKFPHMSSTLIFVPSYFDFVRLRNYFRREEISCVMICEYTDRDKVAQGRALFCHGHRHFMLYTERFHFYHRYQIKGVKHVIFYQLPTYPDFYAEICNFLLNINIKRINPSDQTVTIITHKNDFVQLKHVVGLKNSRVMLKAKKDVFMIKAS